MLPSRLVPALQTLNLQIKAAVMRGCGFGLNMKRFLAAGPAESRGLLEFERLSSCVPRPGLRVKFRNSICFCLSLCRFLCAVLRVGVNAGCVDLGFSRVT